MAKYEIKNLDRLFKKLDNIQEANLENIMKNVGAFVRDDAMLRAPVHDGELRQRMQFEVKVNGSKIEAIVFNGLEYAIYVEFGTGPKGQAKHAGIDPDVNPRYKVDGWFIPIEDFPNWQDYGYKPITVNGKQFIPSLGQPAHPYMYPAYKNNIKEVRKFVSNEILKIIKKEAKK